MRKIHVLARSGVTALILGDGGIARLGGNFQPLPFQDEINGGDFILGLDRIEHLLLAEQKRAIEELKPRMKRLKNALAV